MRFAPLLLFISVVSTLFPSKVFSHGSGPPFLLINGKIADSNPIFTASTQEIILGQDIAAENFIVNEEINFDIVTTNLPAPKEVVERSIFHWYFGDESKSDGLKVSHSYSKSGTFLIKMTVTDPTQNTTFDLNTAQINILPQKGYTLPEARIKINGKLVSDPLKDTFKVAKGDKLEFDASNSTGDNLSYKWDFGDGTAGEGKIVSHVYVSDFFPSFPLLRVTDKNGVADDAFAEFFDKSGGEGFFPNPNYKGSTSTTNISDEKTGGFPALTITLLVIVITGLGTLAFAGKKLREKKENS